jgi:hypothetical protein
VRDSDETVKRLLGNTGPRGFGSHLQSEQTTEVSTKSGVSKVTHSLFENAVVVNHAYFKALIVFFTAMAMLFVAWGSLRWPQFDLAYLLYQGIFVNPMLIVGYLIILSRFKAYHAGILARFNAVMNEQEKGAIHKTTKDVSLFFLYII